MDAKFLLNLNVLFFAHGSSYGVEQFPKSASKSDISDHIAVLDALSEGMTPEMKAKMKEASEVALLKIKELSLINTDERGVSLQKSAEKMTPEEVEMLRIMFDNAEKKFKAA